MIRSVADLKCIARLAVSWLALLAFVCSAFGSISALDRGRADRTGLVFCPLQKKWVNEGYSGKAAPAVPLSDICAPRRRKSAFTASLVKVVGSQIPVNKNLDLTELFFAFEAKGSRAFASLPSAPDAPRPPTTLSEKTVVTAGIDRNGFIAVPAKEFSFEQLSRPPTASSATNFHLPQIADLKTVAHVTNPRGPPLA
jgi:hypothetical protein